VDVLFDRIGNLLDRIYDGGAGIARRPANDNLVDIILCDDVAATPLQAPPRIFEPVARMRPWLRW
jgi:hypothetical protein